MRLTRARGSRPNWFRASSTAAHQGAAAVARWGETAVRKNRVWDQRLSRTYLAA